MAYRRCLVSILFAAALAACSSAPREAPPAPAGTTKQMTEGMKSDYVPGGAVPEMERNRRINEQDCRSGVDLLAGNLRCK
jgi:hypothetical protein